MPVPAASLALALRAARTAASAVAGTLLAAVSLPAAAGEPRAAGEPVLVLAAFPGAGGIDKRAIDLVVAHIRPVGVRLQIVRPGTPRPVLQTLLPDANALADTWDARGVLWIDAGASDELALYVVERDGEQIYGRRIPVLPGQTATALESLANIAGAVAEELREGHVAGLAEVKVAAAAPAPAAPPEPAAAPEPAAPPAAPAAAAAEDAALDLQPPAGPPSPSMGARREASPLPTFAVLAGYTGANFSSDTPWQSAAAFRASWAPVDYAVLGLGYELIPSTSLGDERSTFELSRHPVSTTGQVRLRLPLGLDLQLGARATVDVVERVPQEAATQQALTQPQQQQPPPDHGPGPPPPPPWRWPRMFPQQLPPPDARTDLLVSVAPVVELGVPLTGWLRLKTTLGVDVLLTEPDAAVHPALALSADPVRFLAGVGLEVGLALPASPAPAGMVRR
ncbi:hypothetical protein WME79_42825 [Sorangium sp. So ce726]|uniref:hypothetical protein n=1 Tax=Sorangium sp. So ce726 TaxID=3133319 RepID=UPI003F630570